SDRRAAVPGRGPGNGRGRSGSKGEPRAILDANQSAEVREKLLTEVGNIASAELAVTWAPKAIASKNRLLENDAQLVEAAFERRMAELLSAEKAADPSNYSSSTSPIHGPKQTVGPESATTSPN